MFKMIGEEHSDQFHVDSLVYIVEGNLLTVFWEIFLKLLLDDWSQFSEKLADTSLVVILLVKEHWQKSFVLFKIVYKPVDAADIRLFLLRV